MSNLRTAPAVGYSLIKDEQAGELRTALLAIREARECIELLLEVEGHLQRGNTLNILVAP